MKKYIDADKLIAEIESRMEDCKLPDGRFPTTTNIVRYEELSCLRNLITSLQQEQPMPDSTKLIELWHEDKEMLKEKDFRDDPWRLAYNAFLCGFGRGISIKKQEQPEVPSGEDVMVMCNQILIDWVKDGKTQEEKEQREQAHIRFFELYDDYLMQEQPEVELEKAARNVYESWSGGTMDDVRRDMAELGKVLNARKEV